MSGVGLGKNIAHYVAKSVKLISLALTVALFWCDSNNIVPGQLLFANGTVEGKPQLYQKHSKVVKIARTEESIVVYFTYSLNKGKDLFWLSRHLTHCAEAPNGGEINVW